VIFNFFIDSLAKSGNMKRFDFTVLMVTLLCFSVSAQDIVKEMRWGVDNKIYLTMGNDSVIVLKENTLFHNADTVANTTGFTFLPAGLSQSYVNSVSRTDSVTSDSISSKAITLWSALHHNLGGGWPHFVNAILYALETKKLDLTAPILRRPKSSWKPENPSEAWLRTHEWEYYLPLDMKEAQREYNWRLSLKRNDDLSHLPEDYITEMLSTSRSGYKRLCKDENWAAVARIDLVKLFLGVNYLGTAQVKYIANRVQKAAVYYRPTRLPQVLILDPFNAAVILEMNTLGYTVKQIVFRDDNSNSTENEIRKQRIYELVASINLRNQKAFEQQLKQNYNK
jgi:hypothetical protein